ncbi:MAG: peptide-methionine (S)-S-oxide reductase MsrA [Candidatus Obscuribacterales bacterium]|nr:peptide-methionine (S)-S-oxide reductase MsrA [Candidatus Obscuribacterales bacterium]
MKLKSSLIPKSKFLSFAIAMTLSASGLFSQAAEVYSKPKLETATFAAGCFWHVEDAFEHVPGVKSATSGYTGGIGANPSYEQVCSGKTHHAEAVEVVYDPTKVTYGELLNVFWANHDPTMLNAQGPDHGEQYRSAIFYHSPEQKAAALASEKKLLASGKVKGQIVTQLVPAGPFYRAEEYHQDYVAKHGGSACAVHF